MIYYNILLLLILFLPTLGMATDLFQVDDDSPLFENFFTKGTTVKTPVADYYPADTNSALYKVLKQAQILTAHASFMGRDGIPYKQHSWRGRNDQANLKTGIDCSRSIWFAFTRAGVPYNRQDRYLATFEMWREDSDMSHYFNRCSVNDLRLGDVLVYRGGGAGHTVMVLDPKKKLAWGSHGWDNSGRDDTGVEVQKVVSRNGWRSWDKSSMKLKACWRHKAFANPPKRRELIPSELGQYPETYSQYLTTTDLADKTRYLLWMMRNEMFARYGYRFNNEELTAYFQRQFWYKPTGLSSSTIYYSQFSDKERANMKLIHQYEQSQLVGDLTPVVEPSNPSKDDYLAGTRRLTPADIAGKSKRDLELMRNEIYARHGYRFGRYDLQSYFERKLWYRQVTEDGADLYNNHFSQIERDNVNFLKEAEQD